MRSAGYGPRPVTTAAPPGRQRSALLAGGLAVAAAAYLTGLDSIHAPTIGDESYYLQIARVTAASGRLLPLRSESGITNTKPPLLFWQGIASTGFGRHWELWRLRLPVVGLTFATAAVAGILAFRISGRRAAGVLAALVFLGFRSTIQYGRPFLTNAGETLFLFLPLALLLPRARTGPALTIATGLSLGAAALFKSFFLVVPGAAGLALVLWRRNGWSVRETIRRHGPFLSGAVALGLALFAIWPLADPHPDVVFSQFFLGENAGKFRPETFLRGLLIGPSALWRLWLGDLYNAGLHALPLLGLAVDSWRRRRELAGEEKDLWLFVLAFLVVYSIPTQRQANYLLPTCAALSVLLALRWHALADGWFRATLALLAAALAVVPFLERGVETALGARLFGPADHALPVALAAFAALGAVLPRLGRDLLPALAVAALLVVTSFLAPFSHPFPAPALEDVRGRTVLFPDWFLQAQEKYRFVLPGAEIRPYRCAGGRDGCLPPEAADGAYAAILLAPGAPLPPGWAAVAEKPHLTSRHTAAQIAQMARGRLEPLVDRLVLARSIAP